MSTREVASFRRIYEDTRYGFCIGTAVGFSTDFLKGVYHNRKGKPLKGGLRAARMNTPQFAGYSFIISGTFFPLEYTMEYFRQKDDVLNQITAGAATMGLLSIRRGLIPATLSAVLVGPVVGILFGRNW